VRDGDIITHNDENPPPPEGQQPNITASLQGTSNVANINRIFAAEALKRDFVVGYAPPNHESTILTWPQAFLSLTKGAQGSLLSGSIVPARLRPLWKLLRLP